MLKIKSFLMISILFVNIKITIFAAQTESYPKEMSPELENAIRNDNWPFIKDWLILHPEDIDSAAGIDTLLSCAIESEDLDRVKYCIEKGVNVNSNLWGSTYLHRAISWRLWLRTFGSRSSSNDMLTIIKLLINNGANISRYSLNLASSRGDYEVVKLLLEFARIGKIRDLDYGPLDELAAAIRSKNKLLDELLAYKKPIDIEKKLNSLKELEKTIKLLTN